MSKPVEIDVSSLSAEEIVRTLRTLSMRIQERFPNSTLYRVSQHLVKISLKTRMRVREFGSPITWVRVVNAVLVTILILGLLGTLASIQMPDGFHFFDFVQALEAGINDVVLIGAGVFFLVTLEVRIKRKAALKSLHELRSVAHVIDMLQLTKEPERVLADSVSTESSPRGKMTPYELSRYLDYCSELLSLTGKIAALYVQELEDSVALSAVNEIEGLTTGLSRKIWQKLMIVHNLRST